MIRKIFGRNKVEKSPTAAQTVQNLHQLEDELLMAQEDLESKIDDQMTIIRANGKDNKRASMRALKRKKGLESLALETDDRLVELERQREDLEWNNPGVAVRRSMRNAHDALKAANKYIRKIGTGGKNLHVTPPATDEAIQNLRGTQEKLIEYQQFLQSKMQIQITKANASENKRASLQALKRKESYVSRYKQIDGALSELERKKEALEDADIKMSLFMAKRNIALIQNSIIAAHKRRPIVRSASEPLGRRPTWL